VYVLKAKVAHTLAPFSYPQEIPALSTLCKSGTYSFVPRNRKCARIVSVNIGCFGPMNDGSISKASWLASLSRDLCLCLPKGRQKVKTKRSLGHILFLAREKMAEIQTLILEHPFSVNWILSSKVISYPVFLLYYTPKAMFLLQNHKKHNDSLFRTPLSLFPTYPPTMEQAVFEGVWKGMIEHFAQCNATQQNVHCLE
jgi:hypothetical protein